MGNIIDRVTFTSADFLEERWIDRLSKQPAAIISTWALDDIGSQQAIADIYARSYEVLALGGVLINGDFIKPEGTNYDYEPGRFEVSQHLEMLGAAGFGNPRCLALFEPNISNPTVAQNYACLIATR